MPRLVKHDPRAFMPPEKKAKFDKQLSSLLTMTDEQVSATLAVKNMQSADLEALVFELVKAVRALSKRVPPNL